ncbi:hypothetical protein FE784_16760 [Paenibacillus hemerocallicola]|uniref:Uncharacterized protein n=1 Tax=Paenibacillus hemerocallicola TaxID=1172614 RepID=A0A5C4T9I0_9BACL|nr:hypothetical protein [Paenibacillus hemerocallicola]TNJ65039.1 hypothetical protein FE784_16760 [Paenibacillus hemerocallicola]
MRQQHCSRGQSRGDVYGGHDCDTAADCGANPACTAAIGPPDGFRWTDVPLTVFRDTQGAIRTGFDVADYKFTGAGGTYYVSLSAGNNLNDGLTPATAFKSVWKALAMPDADIVHIDEGVYPRTHAFNGTTIPRSVSLLAVPGKTVVLGTFDQLQWTLEAGSARTYRAARTLVGRVFDTKFADPSGDYRELATDNKMWVDDCVSVGSLFDLRSSSGAALQYRNFRSNGKFSSASGGTIGNY